MKFDGVKEAPVSDSARKEIAPEHGGMNSLDENKVRNVLSVIRSFIRRTAGGSTSVDEYAAHLDTRVNAYTRLLTLLGDGGSSVSLSFLVADTLSAFVARESKNFTISGPEVALYGKAAESLGLALNELALNAVEHGALGNNGSLQIGWTADQFLHISWKESLRSPPAFARSGFGVKFLRGALPFDLNAKVESHCSDSELVWRMKIPAGPQWTVIAD